MFGQTTQPRLPTARRAVRTEWSKLETAPGSSLVPRLATTTGGSLRAPRRAKLGDALGGVLRDRDRVAHSPPPQRPSQVGAGADGQRVADHEGALADAAELARSVRRAAGRRPHHGAGKPGPATRSRRDHPAPPPRSGPRRHSVPQRNRRAGPRAGLHRLGERLPAPRSRTASRAPSAASQPGLDRIIAAQSTISRLGFAAARRSSARLPAGVADAVVRRLDDVRPDHAPGGAAASSTARTAPKKSKPRSGRRWSPGSPPRRAAASSRR